MFQILITLFETIMNTFKSLLIIFTLTVLQACDGESKSTTPTVVEAKIVHEIQPDKIPEYIANFKQSNAEIDFQFEGKKFEIDFVTFGEDNKTIIAQNKLGLLTIGFDLDKEQPIASLSMSLYELQDHVFVIRELNSSNIEVKKQGDNFVYSGSVVDTSTLGLFTVRLVLNQSFFEAGNSTVNVVGTKALVNGTLGTKTYIQIDELIKDHPEVDTLELQQIDGSINDGINMHTGRLIRNA